MEDKKVAFNKIIYFDEDSASDLIYISNQGALREEFIKENRSNYRSKVSGEVGIATTGILKSILGGKFSLNTIGSAGASRENFINRVINNTVLTDYLKLGIDDFKIHIFNKAKVYPYENSLSYIKLLAPYLIMTEGKIDLGEFSLNVSMIDTALREGKGYFEMVLNQEVKSILRFNLNAFRNSYSLPDLVKMDLTYHAVEVGEIKLDNLDVKKEFSFVGNEQVPDAFDRALKDNGVINDKVKDDLVKVYDVILAGVKND
ncbi:MAG: DUF6414 family protein [Tissierellia bacterium]|nr:DUF6414 family protein [Tissierellia bacterium]